MKRLFGSKKDEAPKPTLSDANARLENRGDAIDAKCKKIDEDLVKLKQQIQNSRGPTQARFKQRAMQLLQQKRMYEGQRDVVYQQQSNIDQLQFTTEMIQDTKLQVTALRDTAKTMKKEFKNFRVEDIENMQDDLRELYEDAQEIQEIMGRAYDVPEDIDESDLMDELDALCYDTDKQVNASYLDEALSVPSLPSATVPSGPLPTTQQQVTDPAALESQLGL